MPEVIPKFHLPDKYRRYRLFGKGQIPGGDEPPITVCFFCLDIEADGQVVRLEFSEGLPVKFVNSSIEQFAVFLLLFREEQEWHRIERDKLEHRNIQEGMIYRAGLWSDFQDKAYTYRVQMIEQLEQVDYPATQEGNMWEQTLAELKRGD
jgi:hypothetical protein